MPNPAFFSLSAYCILFTWLKEPWSRFAPASLIHTPLPPSPARDLMTQIMFDVAPLKASLKDASRRFFKILGNNRVYGGKRGETDCGEES